MSITAITIENFKGIREPVRVELKPITLLFGPNSAGKSTVIQALHYAHEIFERQNLNPDRTLLGGDTIDLGGFKSLVHQHDPQLPVTLRFDMDLQNEDLPNFDESLFAGEWEFPAEKAPARIETVWVKVTIRWSEILDKPFVEEYEVGANNAKLILINSSPDFHRIVFSIDPFHSIFLDEGISSEEAIEAGANWDVDDDAYLKMGDLFWQLQTNLSIMPDSYSISAHQMILEGQNSATPNWGRRLQIHESVWLEGLSEERGALIKNFTQLATVLASGPGEMLRDELHSLCYLGPLREVPKRSHKPVSSPEESRWSNGLAAYDTLFFRDEAFIDKVNEWLTQEERLNSGYSVEVKKYRELEADNPLMLAVLQDRILDEDMNLRDSLLALRVKHRLLIQDEAKNIELEPQDIGVGISQVLPVVVAALYHKTGLVAIEQPELHIHPAFQVALGDLFIEQVRQCPDLTFILETHSEHLMLRFLRRVRETGEDEAPENRTLSPAELSIYFIEQGETGIACTPIRVDEEGDFIDRWPKGFFPERAGELF